MVVVDLIQIIRILENIYGCVNSKNLSTCFDCAEYRNCELVNKWLNLISEVKKIKCKK